MKKQIVNITLASMIALGAVSCKEKGADAGISEAKEVAETSASATNFTIDAEKSVINWKGAKPGKDHTGTLKLSSGVIAAINKDISAGNFVIDMNSLTNTDMEGQGKDNLEAHLKGTIEGKEKDFFNVTDFPTATFELTSVSGDSGNIMVSGNLTIKETTQNVEFPAVVSFPGDEIFLKSKPFSIDRTQWGVNFMSKTVFEELKDQFIEDEVELTIELHGKKA
ncbi:MAG: YceI family protein [Bacteroidota bacterium]